MTTLPKILVYTHGLADGGAERLWAALASALAARGYPVVFAQDFRAYENEAMLSRQIPVRTLGRGHLSAISNLARVLREEKPDVLLSAVGGSNTKALLAKAISGSPVRLIHSFHGAQEYRSGILSFLTAATLWLQSRIADRTIAVSDGLRQHLLRRWKASPRRTVTIHNPVFYPADVAVPTRAELLARPEIILAAGRLVAEKDYPTLLRAFRKLDRPKAHLVILGQGPEQLRIETMIAALGLSDRVTLAGYVRQPWRHYAEARCFVLSSWCEPFGNVVVEALAHGLPVVATATVGPCEILENGKHGAIVPIGDDGALAAALDAALDDTGDPAARRARAEVFSFASRLPEYERLIAEVLAQRDRPEGALPTASSAVSSPGSGATS